MKVIKIVEVLDAHDDPASVYTIQVWEGRGKVVVEAIKGGKKIRYFSAPRTELAAVLAKLDAHVRDLQRGSRVVRDVS
jgi:hypothetical protein